MLVSMLTYRTPDQRAVTVVSAWTVGGGTRELARVTWHPNGPMTARQAWDAAVESVSRHLARRDAGEHAPAVPENQQELPYTE